MTEQLAKAATEISHFEMTHDAEYLRSAIDVMEDVNLSRAGQEQRLETRSQVAAMWLSLIGAIERSLDANFDPADVPERGVIPPESGGEELPPGADPKAIKDPIARAQYEAALQENRRKAQQYSLQTKLGRLDPRATTDVQRFLAQNFSRSDDDRKELDRIFGESSISAQRKQQLRAALEKNGK